MKILVTGADGFIGSHLTEYLIRQGHDVRAFIYYNSFDSCGWLDSSPLKDEIEYFRGDIRDPNGVRIAMRGCNAVLHLAALIGIPFSYHSPDAYVDTNIKGTLNVLQAGRELGTQKIVHTSTSEVYGSAKFVPISEAHPLQAQSPYSATKIAADQLALSFWRSFDTPVAILRPFNTYGPRQSTRAFIPSVITQIASGSRSIRLGSLYPTRDFSFVEDTVCAFEYVLMSDNTIGTVLNAGSGFEISMKDTLHLISELMETDIDVEQDVQRKRPELSEVERLWSDTGNIELLTGWRAKYEGKKGFKLGLQKTIEWYMIPQNLEKFKPFQYGI